MDIASIIGNGCVYALTKYCIYTARSIDLSRSSLSLLIGTCRCVQKNKVRLLHILYCIGLVKIWCVIRVCVSLRFSTIMMIITNLMPHYKNGDLFVLCDLALLGFILHFNWAIKSEIFNAGPTFMPNRGIISSLVNCKSRVPSTLLRLNVSQCAVQSLTRRNCDTS